MAKPQAKMEHIDPLTQDTLQALDDLFGLHPGFRPVHAKGILLSGAFTPSAGVESLTKAPHVTRPSIRIAVRFSDFAGVPAVPDYDPENATNAGNGGQGYDMGAMPTTRSFGLNFTITP